MPVAVSPTLCSVARLPASLASVALSTVGWMIVWVRETSSRASRRWKRTRLSAPAALRRSGPAQNDGRAANEANFTFM